MQYARDDGRRVVQLCVVRFYRREGGCCGWERGPEGCVVEGPVCEDGAEEEAGRWFVIFVK